MHHKITQITKADQNSFKLESNNASKKNSITDELLRRKYEKIHNDQWRAQKFFQRGCGFSKKFCRPFF